MRVGGESEERPPAVRFGDPERAVPSAMLTVMLLLLLSCVAATKKTSLEENFDAAERRLRRHDAECAQRPELCDATKISVIRSWRIEASKRAHILAKETCNGGRCDVFAEANRLLVSLPGEIRTDGVHHHAYNVPHDKLAEAAAAEKILVLEWIQENPEEAKRLACDSNGDGIVNDAERSSCSVCDDGKLVLQEQFAVIDTENDGDVCVAEMIVHLDTHDSDAESTRSSLTPGRVPALLYELKCKYTRHSPLRHVVVSSVTPHTPTFTLSALPRDGIHLLPSEPSSFPLTCRRVGAGPPRTCSARQRRDRRCHHRYVRY